MGLLLRCAIPAILGLAFVTTASEAAETFRVCTYNLEGYLDIPVETRQKKSDESKVKIRESICAAKPDVLALQEIGSASALLELRDSLKIDGIDLPHWELVSGWDTNIHVALLSRFPFQARHAYTNENYLLSGRRFHVSRGFAEVDIQVNPSYSFTLFCGHLKSKRATPQADDAEMRLEEARLLREKIDAHLARNAAANLVVLGDFNDTKDAPSTKTLIGRGKYKLVDTRPVERNGDTMYDSGHSLDRAVTWTLYYGKDDTFSRVDYILLSPGMAREWIRQDTFIPVISDWGLASDHRLLVAGFEAEDK
jgi:endonuclease/exonuclease/phosphatase family metal-dependent hydrolase